VDISGFWHIFQIFIIPLLSTSVGYAKCFDFFCFLCGYLGGKSNGTLHGVLGYLNVECFRSEQNTRILTSLGFCHFFQISLSLLSTLQGQSKCLHFFWTGIFFIVYNREAGLIIPLQGLQA
jgi:hypothetical protein